MNYFKKILKYATPYKGFALLNIFFNSLYALFSALSMVAFIPLLEVLFQNTKKVLIKPIYNESTSLKVYLEDWLGYHITAQMSNNISVTLMYVIALIILLFLLKNLFNYLALYFITFLRNGVLKDIRDRLYSKILDLHDCRPVLNFKPYVKVKYNPILTIGHNLI